MLWFFLLVTTAGASLGHWQTPFRESTEPHLISTSNHIFRSLAGLLRTWPQAFAPNGHAIVPATVPTGTLLYHMGSADNPPTSMEWFAFDPEHSYLFSRRFPLSKDSPGSALWTYAATRDLKVLYFDGFSAAKENHGTLDTQDILVFGNVSDAFRDYERGAALCEWGRSHGIEGFARQEATYELIWCDFGAGVKLLGATNTSTYVLPDNVLSQDLVEPLPHGPPGYPPPPGKRRGRDPDRYGAQSFWSHYRAAYRHASVPETRIVPYPEYQVTLYDESYTSLNDNRKLPVRQHRVASLSSADTERYRFDLAAAADEWRLEGHRRGKSGVDWNSVAQAVQERFDSRLSELHKVLQGYTISLNLNATRAVLHANVIAFSMVMPFLDAPNALTKGATTKSRATALAEAGAKCTRSFTGHLSALSTRELKLKEAIEGVLERICNISIDVLGASLTLLGSQQPVDVEATRSHLISWRRQVTILMEWLAWSTWQRCPEQCAFDEACFVEMWPIRASTESGPSPPPQEDSLVPRCIVLDDLLHGDLV